jgi:DHA2 family multidrug resistance protein-like MFS transporter
MLYRVFLDISSFSSKGIVGDLAHVALPAFDVGVSNIIRADATASEAVPAPTKINAKAIVEF